MYAAHIALDENGRERVQTCTEHSRNTAELAKRALMDVDLPWSGYLAGLLHDCGKFTEEFDAYIHQAARGESVHKGSVIHTFAAVSYLLSRYHGAEDVNSCRNLAVEILAAAVASHHGWIDLYDENHESGFEHRLRKQPAYDRRAIEAFTSECCDCKRLDELFSLAEREIENFSYDKLPSCTDESSYEEMLFVSGLVVRLITSALVAADRTDTAAFMQGIPLPEPQSMSWALCERNVDAYLGRFDCTKPIAAARKVFSDACALAAKKEPGIFRLDLPTDGGKTLAALRFAVKHARIHKKKRIIYAAPLLSILEQNALVIRAAVGDGVQVLEHHSNVVQEQSKSNELNTSELLQESWENPLIITTMVQMLETMFGGKMSSVRRFQALGDSVIILDEVQSLPVKMLSLFNLTINFLAECCGTTVVLCSATQPAFAKTQHRMNPHEVIVSDTIRREYAPLFRRTVIHDGGAASMEELAQRAMFQIAEAQSLLIVCNTKKEAAQLYELLRNESDSCVYHLSAGMCMAHRKKCWQSSRRHCKLERN